jgi:hypothetical protein
MLNYRYSYRTTDSIGITEGALYTKAQLDYEVVIPRRFAPFGSPLIVKSKQMWLDNRVAIIQHLDGHLNLRPVAMSIIAVLNDSKSNAPELMPIYWVAERWQ